MRNLTVRGLGWPAVVAALLLSVAPLLAQDRERDLPWARQFGTARVDQANGVVALDGNVYVVGEVIGALPGQTAQGLNDRNAYIRLYDVFGKERWTRQFGSASAGNDVPTSVAAFGVSVYVGGWTSGALAGQAKTGPNDNAFVAKYNIEGDAVWTRQFGTQSTVQALGIAADASGVYVAGAIDCCGSPFPGIVSSPGADAFLRKYDHEGTELWTQQFGGPDSDRATAVAVDGTGVYVVGTTSGNFAGPAASVGLQDVFIRKYGADGSVAWTRQFGTDKADELNAIALAPSGIYVGGRSIGAWQGEKPTGLWDAFVAQLDRDGNVVWARQFGGRDNDNVFSIATGLSSVIVTGAVDGALPGQKYVGGTDAFYRRYDFAGNELSTVQFGGGGNDFVMGASADARAFYVAGGKSGGALGLTPIGDVDSFVLKLPTVRPLDPEQPSTPAGSKPGPSPTPGRGNRGAGAGGK